ncbi:MAG: type II toxin-antitoxin system PemK/MazF family toxin [Actinomyces urogenitalis]|uniref:type II toxin-antitoxin system PemK/MazF family toxin n=1 Tax=Actinomyces urogenitalis TaxID=103621 RepID=UPI002A80DEDC|nr:type II toxin-antitoxin system PemK/MazF family toxin [Actinomyces urogenitalis]MDY3678260.1 type II toxin-antitoxin system PemK/MazF family toxin [Actinomyces urogenitalis]
MRLGQVLGALARFLTQAAPREDKSAGALRGQRPAPRGGAAASARTATRPRSASPTTPASTSVLPYDVARLGLPDFVYAPDPDGDADPGEVVWTWVPYEEDASRGKDRPVLVLARERGRLVVAQMTSKDHDRDAEQEARWGRYWHDVGSGAWDRQGRPSEVRLDRLLLVAPEAVRREGATMDRGTFNGVVAALRAHWTGR